MELPAGARPPAFDARAIVLAPGELRGRGDADWRDALVLVERGEIELEGAGGDRERFGPGAVLWVAGHALRNPGREEALLVAVTRRR